MEEIFIKTDGDSVVREDVRLEAGEIPSADGVSLTAEGEVPEPDVSTGVMDESGMQEETREPRENIDHDEDHTFQNNVTIAGTLRTKRWVHPHGCMFRTLDKLQEEYPVPESGMWAFVGTKFPGEIWICRKRGVWEKSDAIEGDKYDRLPDTVAWGKVTGKPTTIAGYGITDAKISGGVITIGTASIRPLTEHQPLTDYLKKTDAASTYQPKGNYLTEHQPIHALTLKAGAFTAVTYNPKTGAATVNIPTTTSHMSEGTRLYFTDARAVAALKATTDALNTAISKKLDTATFTAFKAVFDSMFELVTENGVTSIKAKLGLWTPEFLSAKGKSLTESPAGASQLRMLTDVSITDPKSGQSLVFDGEKWVNRTVDVGLDTAQLSDYLSANNYARKSDIPSLTGYATETWVEGKRYLTEHQDISGKVDKVAGKGLSTNDFTTALLDKLNGIAAGANKYVHPTHTARKIAVAAGLVLSSITVNAEGHVTEVGSKTLTASDIPALAISKITGLRTELDGKATKDELKDVKDYLDSLFTLETDAASPGGKRIRANFGLYSGDYISAKGVDPDSGVAGGGAFYGRLDTWEAYDANAGDVLSATLGVELRDRLDRLPDTVAWGKVTGKPTTIAGYGITDAKISGDVITIGTASIRPLTEHQPLTDYLKKTDAASTYLRKTDASATYLTKTDASSTYQPKGNYLTEHQPIHALTLKAGAFTAVTYNPKSVAATVNIPTTTSHISEGTRLYFTDARAVAALKATTDALNTAISKKLDTATFTAFKAVFDSMFEKVTENGVTSIKAKLGLWTPEFLSAKGKNAAASGGGAGFGLVKAWPSANPGTGTTDALGLNLGCELRDTLSGHTGDGSIHITAAERTRWNKVVTDFAAITGTDSDTVINKWEEVVAFLDTYTEADTLAGLLGHKADKSTTLSGYGITDGVNSVSVTGSGNAVTAASVSGHRLTLTKGATYLTSVTKAMVEGVLTGNVTSHTHSQYVDLTSAQTITGAKTFTGDNGVTFSGANPTGFNYRRLMRSTNTSLATSERDYAWQLYHSTDASWRGLSLWSYDGDNKVFNQVINIKAYPTNQVSVNGTVTATTLVKKGGTASQVLMADGSVQTLWKATDVTTATSDTGMITPLAMNQWTAKTYVTSLGVSGNYLTWTKNGATNNITVPYATGAGKLTAFVPTTLSMTHRETVAYFAGGGNTVSDKPGGVDAFGMLSMRTADGWQGQLLMSSNTATGLYWRTATTLSGGWRTVIDSGNYAAMLDGRYMTLNTVQTVSAAKTFAALLTATAGIRIGDCTVTFVNGMLRFSTGIYSEGAVSAKGGSQTSGGVGFGLVKSWDALTASNKTTDAVSAELSDGLRQRIAALEGKNYLDALTLTATGSGNAVTSVSLSADKRTLTVTKGVTFLTGITKAQVEAVLTGTITTHSHNVLASSGRLTAVGGTDTMPSGLRLHEAYNDGYPTQYGNLLRVGGRGSGELLLGWSGSTTPTLGRICYRSKRDVASTEWSAWGTVAYTSDMSISGGVITINGVSITPLTQQQALANYVTLNSTQTITGAKTFTSPNANCITLRRSNSNGGAFIDYYASNSTSVFWRVGMTADNDFGFAWGTNLTNARIDSAGNVYATAFKKVNGTASQFLKADGSVDGNSYATTAQLTNGSVTKVGTATVGGTARPIYLNAGTPAALSASVGAANRPVYLNAGTITAGTYTFGNASGNAPVSNGTVNTNLNADMLDGIHAISFEGYYKTTIDASGLDNDTWYPVTIAIGNSLQTRIRIEGCTDADATWNSRSDKGMAVVFDWIVNGSQYGWTNVQRTVLAASFGAGSTGSNCVRGIGQLTRSSNEYVFVRGGAKYDFYVSRNIVPVLRTSSATINGQTIAPATTDPGAIVRNNALITDNVASATKLQTSRTLWGQPFNGTANVDGAMTINYTGETGILLKRAESGSGAFMRFCNNNQTANYFRVGMYGAGHFGITYNGVDAITILSNRNVGIGTTAPAFLLDVAGAARVTTLRIGEATISYDSATGMLKFDKGIYSTGAVSAKGASSTSGGGGIIQKVYGSGSLGDTFSDTVLTDTFNAYTIDKIRKDLLSRITTLEGGSALSVVTSGSGNAVTSVTKSGTVVTVTKGSTFALSSGVVTALGTSGNYLTWTKNGMVNNITVPYATNADTVDGIHANRFMYSFGSTEVNPASYDGNYAGMTTKSGIDTNWWWIQSYGWGLGNNVGNKTWVAQLALPSQTRRGLRYRTGKSATEYSEWVTVLDNSNYAAMLDSRYYTEGEIDTKLGSYYTKTDADGRYVNATGDTMTGRLTITGAAADRPLTVRGISGSDGNGAVGDLYLQYGVNKSLFLGNTGAHNISADGSKYTGNAATATNADMLDGWHAAGQTGSVLKKSGYVSSPTSGLSSYWGKLATVNVTSNENKDITLYLHSAYNNLYGTLNINIRINSGGEAYTLRMLDGNIPVDRIRLYKAASAPRVFELWVNVVSIYGVINAVVLSETDRTAIESGAWVTMHSTYFNTVQTPTLATYITPSYTSLLNNVASATKLQTARTINGTSFDGTAAITTANWGTARSIGIVNSDGTGTAVVTSVNGSANINLKLPATIKAALTGNATTATTLQSARTIWGQTFNGGANVSGNMTGVGNITGSAAMTVSSTGGRLTLNGAATALDLKFANTDAKSVILNGTAFKPYDAADNALDLGTDDARWKKITACNMRLSSSKAQGGGDVYAELWRGTNASWKIVNTGGYLKFQSNYTTAVTSWFDCVTVDYNTGHLLTKGELRSKSANAFRAAYGNYGFIIRNDSDSTYFLLTASGSAYGTFNSLRPFRLLNSSGDIYMGNGSLVVQHNGNVGLSTTNPLYKLHVAGTAYASTGFFSDGYVSAKGQSTTSDIRLKRILRTVRLDIRDIARAPSVEFEWRKDGARDVGSVAQYWERLMPRLVNVMPDGMKGLQYGKAALLGVIAVARETESLRERCARLESRVRELEDKLR